MRIRGTKPEFWKSKRIAAVSWDARLVLKGLESYVDDNGVGVDDIELVVTDVFPRDMFANPRETVARVSEAISELHHAGLVHRYEVNGEHLLFISFWESVQRIDKPGKGRFPRPDGTFAYNDSEIRESVASPRESVAPVTGEQGNRGTGEQVGVVASVATSPARNSETGKTGTRIPADFKPTPHMLRWAQDNAPNVDWKTSTRKFTAHYRSVSGRTQFKTDWDEAWKAWLIGDQEKSKNTGQYKTSAERKLEDGAKLYAKYTALEEAKQQQQLEGTPT